VAETATGASRPAFYALAPGGWRDYVTLLHPPYTLWHLSYVVVGASLAPALSVRDLGATLAAFFLAVGIGAHALDELNGRPLRTRIPGPVLVLLAAASIAGATALGIYGALTVEPLLGVFVAGGVFIVGAYNLELAAGRFHSDAWFALAWGSFPVLTAYFAQAGELRADAALAALYASAMSLGQRRLSTQVRVVRRRVLEVEGIVRMRDGALQPVTSVTLTAAAEGALRALTLAAVAVAVALLTMRLA
jgi:hypothetical protein